MKNVTIAVIAILMLILPASSSGQKNKQYITGLYLGNQVLADGTYTNNIHCTSGEDYTCRGSAGFNGFRAYYVQTDEGVWTLITDRQATDVTMRSWGMGDGGAWWGKEKPNLLDSLKPGDKVAFRIAKDHRIGAGDNYHVFIPRAENPNKEDKFVGTPPKKNVPVGAPKPVDNIKAMCDAHKFSPRDEEKYCQTPSSPTPALAMDKLAADRKTFLDTINMPGRKGRGEIVGDTLTLHTAECNKQNFDLLVVNPHMQEIFKNLQIKTFVYTNDLDLMFMQEIK